MTAVNTRRSCASADDTQLLSTGPLWHSMMFIRLIAARYLFYTVAEYMYHSHCDGRTVEYCKYV